MKKTIFITFLFAIVFRIEIAAQISIDTSLVLQFDSVHQICIFKPNLSVSINDLITNHPSNFRLMTSANTLVNTESMFDSILDGMFYRFQQKYNNIPVEKSMLGITYDAQQHPFCSKGNIYQNINLSTVPTISDSSAIYTAISAFPSNLYYWQDSTSEADVKVLQNDPLATNFPGANLVVLPILDSSSYTYFLSYKVTVKSADPLQVADIFVDANSGLVLEIDTIDVNCGHINKDFNFQGETKEINYKGYNLGNASGSNCAGDCQTTQATLHKYGTQNISTEEFPYGIFQDCNFRLKDNCSGTVLYTRRYFTNAAKEDIRNNSSLWGNGGTDRDGTTAHWSLERAHDFFRFNYNWNGWDNKFSQVNLNINFNNSGVTGARHTKSEIIISKAYGYQNPFVFVDYIGHEFTHGIVENTCVLDTKGEPGTLNEGFGDIFGTMIKYYTNTYYTTGQASNYIFGDLAMASGSGDRSLIDPNSHSQPDTYKGNFWATSANFKNDEIVHINTGVLGYWFYLLAEGGSGVNDNNDSYCVQGIGREAATDIAWLTVTKYLKPTSDYDDCRAASILAATKRFKANSNELAQVIAAWYAVGVGQNFSGIVDVKDHTASGTENYNYNNNVEVFNFIANNLSDVTITSNTQINMLPNTAAKMGSEYKAFIAPACNGGARMANFNGSTNDEVINTNQNNLGLNKKSFSTTSKEKDLTIIPNPNNGEFDLILDNTIEIPNSIVIQDILGKSVFAIQDPMKYEFNFKVNDIPNGIFIIKVIYSDHIASKKFVKM